MPEPEMIEVPHPDVIRARMRACRDEARELARALRVADALHNANKARARREALEAKNVSE
jgi:hypothetical protein